MISNPRILILEDEEQWRNSHELRLMKAGFDCLATSDVKEAIQAAKIDPAIKFALIDEILYVSPVPRDLSEGELQRWQGYGVIREINKQRSDIQFIIISNAPQRESDEQDSDNHVFRQKTAELRRQPGVIDMVHKADIEDDGDGSYTWIIDLLKRAQTAVKAEVVTPKILIGLGFSKDVHESMVEQMEVRKRQYLPIAPLIKKGGTKFLDQLMERAAEKSVFLEMPGSKRLDRIKTIKPNSSAFRILSFLALQTERQVKVWIGEQDYEYTRRQTSKASGLDVDSDAIERQAYAFGYNEDGRKGLRDGVQLEGNPSKSSPLKVAIHRLSHQLHELNVGPARQLFQYEVDGYRPEFELGIVVYAVRETKKKSKPKS